MIKLAFFVYDVCPEGFEPPSAEPESAILSIELWAPDLISEQI